MTKGRTASQKKDKKITIMQLVDYENGMGDWISESKPLPGGTNIWAYYRQASANEFYAAASTSYKVEAIFRIKWIRDLDTKMTVLFRGKEYGITRIDDFEGYKEDLTIYAYAIIH